MMKKLDLPGRVLAVALPKLFPRRHRLRTWRLRRRRSPEPGSGKTSERMAASQEKKARGRSKKRQ